MDNIPLEIAEKIFAHVDSPRDHAVCRQVSQTFAYWTNELVTTFAPRKHCEIDLSVLHPYRRLQRTLRTVIRCGVAPCISRLSDTCLRIVREEDIRPVLSLLSIKEDSVFRILYGKRELLLVDGYTLFANGRGYLEPCSRMLPVHYAAISSRRHRTHDDRYNEVIGDIDLLAPKMLAFLRMVDLGRVQPFHPPSGANPPLRTTLRLFRSHRMNTGSRVLLCIAVLCTPRDKLVAALQACFGCDEEALREEFRRDEIWLEVAHILYMCVAQPYVFRTFVETTGVYLDTPERYSAVDARFPVVKRPKGSPMRDFCSITACHAMYGDVVEGSRIYREDGSYFEFPHQH